MDAVQQWIETVGGAFWTWLLLPVVVITGLYFTIRTQVVQIRMFPAMLRTLRDPVPNTPSEAKPISSFQAFCVSAASRVGVGNIAGVGTAIATGGPGAVFWMWLMAVIGASSAFIESTLAQVYKRVDPDGSFRGGPAYYMQYGLGRRWMGILFAIVLVLCFPLAFSSLQANTITDAITNTTGWTGSSANLTVGIVLAVLTAAVVFGGMHRIANVADKIVPIMAILYLIVGLVIVVINIRNVPTMIGSIFADAFTPNAATGGAIGTVILIGVQRGMFSNEAGLGSAPNAGASAAVTHPAKQGFVQSLGVYFDTLVVCSITAFIILSSRPDVTNAPKGITLTQEALVSGLGSWAGVLLTVIIFLLAFSSILGNYYYGESNVGFMFGESRGVLTSYRVIAVAAILVGSLLSAQLVWSTADQVMGVMALVNLIAILLLSGLGLRTLTDYSRQLKQGKDPVFVADEVGVPGHIEFWQSREQVTGEPEAGAPTDGARTGRN